MLFKHETVIYNYQSELKFLLEDKDPTKYVANMIQEISKQATH